MKLQKNKLIAVLTIVGVVLFIVGYSILTFRKKEDPEVKDNQVPVPKLGDGQKQYKSKLEALDALKEEREVNAPSVYDERLLDSTGTYDPDLPDKEKMRIIDSIYAQGKIDYTEKTYRHAPSTSGTVPKPIPMDMVPKKVKIKQREIVAKEIGLEHQLFFASDPNENPLATSLNTDSKLSVRVDGTQTVKQHYRLRMRLNHPAKISGKLVPRNTLIYGFVSFKPNRTLITIEHIDNRPITFGAYDLADGSEGIYIENSFREEVQRQVVGDVVDDVNVPGVPQVSGIKQLFRRNNRQVKVTVLDDYQIILKLEP
ncbi:conjugative transposon protein TraM [Muricauda sp. TY007]|uniref:conjugative transposon protein TraM n=1 Tax=Allomuricauda sp. TY007 TaxID=2683200 RepID=UPI0013C14DFA|nr:conjugative transposon protein TraM [Muricauda sp. TY007]NDV15792.1 conjugative transposon protein TraM [Muricauda sp. TY007]